MPSFSSIPVKIVSPNQALKGFCNITQCRQFSTTYTILRTTARARSTRQSMGSSRKSNMASVGAVQRGDQNRSIVFVRGQRVQGLIRDPSEILSSDGVSYGATKENLSALKNYVESLSLSTKIELPDDLLLQIITHKSFAHGSKPYNANLSFLGEQILQLCSTKYVLTQSSGSIDAIGSLAHRLMWSDKLLAAFAEAKGIDSVFFCKKALPGGKTDKLYKPKGIYSTITSSLIGAIASKYGKTISEEFIQKELIPAYKI